MNTKVRIISTNQTLEDAIRDFPHFKAVTYHLINDTLVFSTAITISTKSNYFLKYISIYLKLCKIDYTFRDETTER